MITNMTPSRIEFDLGGVSYTVHGEALDPAFGLDYVIYADDFHFTDSSNESVAVPENIKRKVLQGIRIELSSRGTRFEIEPEEVALTAEGLTRCEGNLPCPRAGFWFTPAQAGSRRFFKDGELMLAVSSDYGATIWQWDQNQDPPKL